ncbi:unnamed protein product [Dovyalis caffra]|uniref:Pentatricopeptide repeat-containing protein n=1 Tax=Dovyalis caffra TaxID=77055 RepID=A0AAV1RVY6_9ROSI|nr:unnamed protein product [Dovyalis caffra]
MRWCTGVRPNDYTFSAVLPACGEGMIVVHGERMHCLIRNHGFETDLFVGTDRVLDDMPERNLVSWNSVIVGFLQNKLCDMAIGIFKEVMGEASISPNQVSFSSVLSACATVGTLECGRQVHGVAIKHGLVTLAYVRNSLMDMYSKCGGCDTV